MSETAVILYVNERLRKRRKKRFKKSYRPWIYENIKQEEEKE